MPVRGQKYKLQLCYDFVLEAESARSLENLETHSSHFLKMRTAGSNHWTVEYGRHRLSPEAIDMIKSRCILNALSLRSITFAGENIKLWQPALDEWLGAEL